MSAPEKHTCEKVVWDRFNSQPHGVSASLEHNGRWYCKMHHPPTLKAKADAKYAAWQAKWDAARDTKKKADDIQRQCSDDHARMEALDTEEWRENLLELASYTRAIGDDLRAAIDQWVKDIKQ